MIAFFLLRRQHPGQRGLHFVHSFVNDVVVAQIHAVRADQLSGRGVGTRVEPDDDRVGGQRKVDIRFCDGAYTA